MFLRGLNKRGSDGVEEVVKWILYIGILVVVVLAIVKIFEKFG